MYDNYSEVKKFVNKLEDSFVLTGSEVVHIRNVHYLANTQFFHHDSYLYTEIHIVVDATSYSMKDGELVKDEIQSLYLSLNTSEVLKATQENVAVLLVDECVLVREAAADLYRKAA